MPVEEYHFSSMDELVAAAVAFLAEHPRAHIHAADNPPNIGYVCWYKGQDGIEQGINLQCPLRFARNRTLQMLWSSAEGRRRYTARIQADAVKRRQRWEQGRTSAWQRLLDSPF